VATTALLLAVPFAVAGVVRAGSPPVQKLAWSAVVLWAVGASAFGWALAHLMDEIA
jgi:hypothetical protein